MQPPSSPRGRPRDPTKREAVLDAALALFLQQGPDAVTIDQVVAESGVSRATVYANFPDKAAIVEAVILRETDRICATKLGPDQPRSDYAADSFKQALIEFGIRLLRFLSDPQLIRFEWLIAATTRNAPALGLRFYTAGPGRSRETLTRIIKAGHARNLISARDPDAAATDLVGLWQGFLRTENAYGQLPLPGDAQLRKRATHGVNQFLRLYAPAAPKK